jgi:hypothetical protein
MKRILLAGLVSLALTAPAIAGQCPVDMGKIDAALAKGASLSAAQLAEVTKLRSQGEQEHKSGKHGASVKTLAKAKKILGVM